jgi:hypothetical protein
MSRPPDSGELKLGDVFRRAQTKMIADLETGDAFEHGPSQGTASEQQWLALLGAYLPRRFRASPAFIINGAGKRSHQIDIAVYDDLQFPPLFPHSAGIHIPIESVFAVLEVKHKMDGTFLRYAGQKAASVRKLRGAGHKRPILAGLLATESRWHADTAKETLRLALGSMPPSQRVDLGCSMSHFAFEYDGTLHISEAEETLIFFVLRLIQRLNALGPAPPIDLDELCEGARVVQGVGVSLGHGWTRMDTDKNRDRMEGYINHQN